MGAQSAIEQLQSSVAPAEGSASGGTAPRRGFLQSSLSSIAGTLPTLGGLSDEDDDEVDDYYNDSELPYGSLHPTESLRGCTETDSSDDHAAYCVCCGGKYHADELIYDSDESNEDPSNVHEAFQNHGFLDGLLQHQSSHQPVSPVLREYLQELPVLLTDSDRDEETGSSEEEEESSDKLVATDYTSSMPSRSTCGPSPTEPLPQGRKITESHAEVPATAPLMSALPGDEVLLDFGDLNKHSITELERFCECQGILLQRKHRGKRKKIEDGTPEGDKFKLKLIELIKRYKDEEIEEDVELQLAPEVMSAEACKARANALLTGTTTFLSTQSNSVINNELGHSLSRKL